MIQQKNILFSTLNWGLGHASRSIPIIRELSEHNKVVLAADGDAYQLLTTEFPLLPIYRLADVNIHYLPKPLLSLGVVFNGLKMNRINREEHREIAEIIAKHAIDLIISDNRYGVWSPSTKNILITHQLTILPPTVFRWTQPLLDQIIRKKLAAFDEIWVPDTEASPGLAGKMSHCPKQHPNIRYIGPQSRYHRQSLNTSNQPSTLVALVSGPMPFRQQLLKKVAEVCNKSAIDTTIFCGGNADTTDIPNSITIKTGVPFEHLNLALNQADIILCSGGYTTLMDLSHLQKKAIIIPTPGQTEQEYLARLHRSHPRFIFLNYTQLDQLSTYLELLKQSN